MRAVENRFGVDASILVSIWGIESSFGEARDPWDVFRSLATLAYARFQQPYFRNELLSALAILQQGRIPRRQFLGSWAGAMGQAQFMPSSYLTYAVDFDGDGRPDIWTSVPDVLASIANYLHKAGWQSGLPWGFEVECAGKIRLPDKPRHIPRMGGQRLYARGWSGLSRCRRRHPVLSERRGGPGLSGHREFHRA